MPPLSTHIIYTTLTQIVNKISARVCWYCRQPAYGRNGCCMNTKCRRYWAGGRGHWREAQKVMIQVCCRLSRHALLNSQNATFHTISCKQYALPNQSNPPALQDKARSRLSSLMWHTRKYKYTKTLVLQNEAVPVFKHLFFTIVHCFVY